MLPIASLLIQLGYEYSWFLYVISRYTYGHVRPSRESAEREHTVIQRAPHRAASHGQPILTILYSSSLTCRASRKSSCCEEKNHNQTAIRKDRNTVLGDQGDTRERPGSAPRERPESDQGETGESEGVRERESE